MGGKNQAGVSGDGFRFEHDVGAILSVLMLADSGLDLFPDEKIISIQPQYTENRKVDDFALIIQGKLNPSGRKVYIQSKRTISIASSGPFADTVFAAYCDYSKCGARDCEEYILITGPLKDKDYLAVDDAFANIHERHEEQFFRELNFPSLEDTQRIFNVCKDAVKNRLKGKVLDERRLFDCLKHFHILRPDLRVRGSLDGSFAVALLGIMGYERVDDALRKIREKIETKSFPAAQFFKKDVFSWLLPYMKSETNDDTRSEGEESAPEVLEDTRSWSKSCFQTWVSDINRRIFEDLSSKEECRLATIELGERAYALGKQPISIQSEWADAVWGMINKFADAEIAVWGKASDGLSYLAEIGISYFINRIDRDCRKIKEWLKSAEGVFAIGYLLRGFAQKLNEGLQWLKVYTAVLTVAKAEYELGVYREAHSFIEYFLSESNRSPVIGCDLRKGTIKEILRCEPEIGWRILLNLVPAVRVVRMSYAAQSVYNDFTSGELIKRSDIETLQHEYVGFACELAMNSEERLLELIRMSNVASKCLFEGIINATKEHIKEYIDQKRDIETKRIWESLMDAWEAVIVTPFAEDEVDERQLALVGCADLVQPDDNRIVCERSFAIDEVYLKASIIDVLGAKLDAMIKSEGIDAIIPLASRVKCPGTIGKVLYEKVGSSLLEKLILPGVASGSSSVDEFIRVYLVCCFSQEQIEKGLDEAFEWLDATLNFDAAYDENKGAVYSRLYFARKIREKAIERLGNRDLSYWSGVKIGLYPDKDLGDISTIVDGLLLVGRALDAVKECRYAETLGNDVNNALVFRSVIQFSKNLPAPDICRENREYLNWAIRRLNADESLPMEEMSDAELRMLPYYYDCHDFQSQRPIATYRRMSQDACFFVELMKLEFPMARTWSVCPGTRNNGFDESGFMEWLDKVYELTYDDIALRSRAENCIAEVMNYLPDEQGRPFVYPKIWTFLESGKGATLLGLWKTVLRRGGSIVEIMQSVGANRNLRRERYQRYSAAALNAGFSKIARVFEETAG